ncbi:zinc finger and BTB domain-containing protein 16-A isoform X2 [Engraulis encrasicolus]|uniref:zinc finger and BTB domain-containing protein 16-A isoform X2 n=1 Tax=Engraulis encrasicolus TaxID=184585 RepID=UPI002FD064CC
MDLSKMGTIHLQNPGHPGALLHKANQMRLSGTLCDVVIMVDAQEFRAHRTVLACASKMFEILFHRASQHYTLDFLSPKTFQQILDYAYTATLQAKLEDLDDLLYAAEILEIEYIEEQCLKILETIQASEEHVADMADVNATSAATTDNNNSSSNNNGGPLSMAMTATTAEEEEAAAAMRMVAARHLKSTLLSKKHSTMAGADGPFGGGGGGGGWRHHRLALSAAAAAAAAAAMAGDLHNNPLHHYHQQHQHQQQLHHHHQAHRQPGMGHSPPGGGQPTLSPTKAAVDSLMSLGQALAPPGGLMERIKTEMMQVDEQGAAYGHEGGGNSSNGDGIGGGGPGGDGSRQQDGPGTPTRSSVITSARELHVPGGRDDGSGGAMDAQMDLGGIPGGLGGMGGLTATGLAERHLASLYASMPANHKSEPSMLGMPGSMPMSPSLAAMSAVDLGAYGSLLQQSFMQREFFSKLGDYAMKTGSDAAVAAAGQLLAQTGDRCHICGLELPDSDAVEQHRKLHSGMKTYGCEFCGKHFLDSLRLRMHMLSHTGGAKALVCDQCGNQYAKEEELEAHRRTHSSSDMAVFCLLCGKRFATQKALQQHMEVHAGVRSYICSECDRTFPSHTALKRHLRSHTGDHPFECEFCGSCFRDENTLKGHKRIHTGEKPYECNGCGKKFSLKHQLETHYRVHTGEKPFECKLCHQRSRDYSAMIKHLRTHNGASPYQCTICQEYCPSLSSMQKHMKNHKPEDVPADWRIEKTYLYLCYV